MQVVLFCLSLFFIFALFDAIEDDVHNFSRFIAVFEDEVAVFFSMVSNHAHTIEGSTFNIFQGVSLLDCLS